MKIIYDAYIVEWEVGKYAVTHDDLRIEREREFLAECGVDFYMQGALVTVGISNTPPLFDSISKAEQAWDKYKEARDQYLSDVDRRKLKVKDLN